MTTTSQNLQDPTKQVSYRPRGAEKDTGQSTHAVSEGEAKLTEVSPEKVELDREVESSGAVEVTAQQVDIPPELASFGVSQPAAVSGVVDPSQVTIPISDQKVLIGLHQDIASAFHWLAVWCLKRLHAAHLTLKVIHGHVKRVLYPW